MNRVKFIIKSLIGHRNLRELSYLGKVASTYLQDRAATVLWHEEHIFFARFFRRLPDSLTVLDVPVGTGRFVPFYEIKNWTVVGLDISPEMLETAKKYNTVADCIEFEQGSIVELPYADDHFDLVVCSRFLGYILTVENAKVAIDELKRVAKSWVIVGLQYVREGELYGNEDKIGHKFYRSELINLLNEKGFTIEDSVVLGEKDNYKNELFMLSNF